MRCGRTCVPEFGQAPNEFLRRLGDGLRRSAVSTRLFSIAQTAIGQNPNLFRATGTVRLVRMVDPTDGPRTCHGLAQRQRNGLLAEIWPSLGPSSRRLDMIPRGRNRRAAERPETPQERRTEIPVFGSPFSGLAHDRKLSDEELVRAIRFMVAAEYEAIQLYMQLAESTDKTLAVNVLKDIADEERVHAGEFLRLLRELAPDEDELYAQGAKEVEGAIQKIVRGRQVSV